MRFVDFTLARALGRETLVIRTIVVLVVAGALLLLTMMAGTWIGLSCCVPADADPPSAGVIVRLAMSLATVMTCWGGMTLAIGMLSRRRAVAASIAGLLALTTYLLDYLGRAWEPAATISRLSPFHYFEPMAVIMRQSLNAANATVLIAVGVAGAIASYVDRAARHLRVTRVRRRGAASWPFPRPMIHSGAELSRVAPDLMVPGCSSAWRRSSGCRAPS